MAGESVLVLGKLDGANANKLKAVAGYKEHHRENSLSQELMIELLKDKDAVISEPLDQLSPHILDQCPHLKIISNRAVGFDNINLEEASKRGILVTNTPGVLDAATADLAFALLLSVARRIVEADKYVREGLWKGFRSDLMLGPDIYGKTVGIVGLGRIGKAFAQRANAFGLKIIYTRFSKPDDKDSAIQRELKATRVDLDSLLKNSDFVSLHCPYNDATHHLIGHRELNLMKPQSVLINTSRGKVIDESALIEHLTQKKIFGAGLDVFEQEPMVPQDLKALDNVVLTPHIGSACIDTRHTMTALAVEAIVDAFNGRQPTHLLNQNAWSSFLDKVNN